MVQLKILFNTNFAVRNLQLENCNFLSTNFFNPQRLNAAEQQYSTTITSSTST